MAYSPATPEFGRRPSGEDQETPHAGGGQTVAELTWEIAQLAPNGGAGLNLPPDQGIGARRSTWRWTRTGSSSTRTGSWRSCRCPPFRTNDSLHSYTGPFWGLLESVGWES